MNSLTKNQTQSLSESFEIINLDKVKFAELVFAFLKFNHPKYENIFNNVKIEDVRSFMGSVREVVTSSSHDFLFPKAIRNFGSECLKICGRPEDILHLEKAWSFGMEEWLGPWHTLEIEESWKEVFNITYLSFTETLQWS
ncbi:hypothetical protein A0128_16140 [Leptospira tipperaryensis]|uniref:Globin n=1 Tax=Leptospira tipperaryensis TaxID=2564040 RepID=A0A1D7V2T6_9LEPT|nr:globin [Leptospira tipperaryensis]AOP36130.1 hypothetical protein A0128_16140 [Leptospira tipperaryensis]